MIDISITPCYIFLAIIILLICVLCRAKIEILIFSEYVLAVLLFTVLGRSSGYWDIRIIPFWSYGKILEGEYSYVIENLMNAILMVPFGYFLFFLFSKSVNKVIIISALFELTIELLQYFLHCGLAEWDDIFHGVIGSLLGCLLFKLISNGN